MHTSPRPGTDHSGESVAEMEHNSSVELRALSPREFEARISDGDSFVVNGHVPVDDRIVGTDESIAFDAIVGSDRLPADKDKSILGGSRMTTTTRSPGR